MIFGDPHKFAILAKEIPEWTVEGSYINGLFHYIVDSKFFPDYTVVSALGTDIGVHLSENSDLLFNMPKEEAFAKMLNAMRSFSS